MSEPNGIGNATPAYSRPSEQLAPNPAKGGVGEATPAAVHPVVQAAAQHPEIQAIAAQHPAKGGAGHPATVMHQLTTHPVVQAAVNHPAKGGAGHPIGQIGASIGGVGHLRAPMGPR